MKDLLTAAKEILHLHMCEQEGMSSGQPTPIMWLKAVDDLSDAIDEAGKTVSPSRKLTDEKEELYRNVIERYQLFTRWVVKHTPEIQESERGLNHLNDIDWAEHKIRDYENPEKE